jgi:hypothetical protein
VAVHRGNTRDIHVVLKTKTWNPMHHFEVSAKEYKRFCEYMKNLGYFGNERLSDRGTFTRLWEHPIYGTGHHFGEVVLNLENGRKKYFIGLRVSNVLC